MEIGIECHEDVWRGDKEKGDGGIETKLLRKGLYRYVRHRTVGRRTSCLGRSVGLITSICVRSELSMKMAESVLCLMTVPCSERLLTYREKKLKASCSGLTHL